MVTDDNYFDHEADIGIIGRGATLEDSFINAAEALFAFMIAVDLSQIQKSQSIAIQFLESDIELAFVTWLNRLLAEARCENLILAHFELKREGDQWTGQAYGEPWNDAIPRGTEVKGATLTELSVKHTSNGWESRCVVDV